jgi:transposase
VQVITRDRAGAYADGCTRGAPQATQCTDRWHLWKNLGDAVEKTVIAHRECLHPADPTDAADSAATAARAAAPPPSATAHRGSGIPVADVPNGDATAEAPAGGEGRLAPRSRERYAQVHALRAQGKGMRTIGKELGLDRKTVRRFLQAVGPDQICFKAASRAQILDGHRAYLHRRWIDGCTNASQLFTEIRAQGYRGSIRTVYRYVQTFRDGQTPPDPEPPSPLKVRHVVGWIMQDPDNLDPEDEQRLRTVLQRCSELAAARRHVGAFAHMIRDLCGDRLPEWIDRVHADNLPALHSFITGLYQDLDAVTAGLTLEHNNGRAEGTVNRIKAVKRAMFGRANLDLLKKRILLA